MLNHLDALSGHIFFKKSNKTLRDIIKIFSYPRCYDNTIQKSAHFYLKRLLYPIITKEQRSDISKNIDELTNLPDILTPISGRFAFSFELLQTYESSPEDHHYIISLIFIISWFCLYDLHLYHDALPYFFSIISKLPDVIPTDMKKYCLNECFHHYIRSTKQPIDSTLFSKAISNPDPYYFDLILAEFFVSKDQSTSNLCLDLIETSFTRYQDSFLELGLSPLIDSLSPLYKTLNASALRFLSLIIEMKHDESLNDEIVLITSSIKQRLKTETIFPDLESHSFPSKGFSDFLYNFDTTDTLPNGFNSLNSNIFATNKNLDCYMCEDNLSLIEICETFVTELKPKYADIFIDSMTNFISNKRNDPFYILFVYSCSKLDKIDFSVHVLNTLFNPYVFSSNITVFDKQYEIENQIEPTYQKYEIAYLIRKKIYDLFLQHDRIELLFHYFQESPFIFAEIICLIHSNLSIINLKSILNNDNLHYIMHVLSLLWYFCSKKNLTVYNENSNIGQIESKDLWKYQSARSTIFVFLFDLLSNQDISNICFSSQTFSIGFLARAFEPSLERFILMPLSNFLRSSPYNESMINVLQVISAIFDACQEKNKELASNFLHVLDTAASLNQSVHQLESVLTPIISFLSRCPSLNFLKATLHVLTQISHSSRDFSLTPQQSKLLSTAVREIEADDILDEIISSFIAMIGLSHTLNLSSMFIIKNPYGILLLFSILKTREKLEEVLNFFTNLCKHSIYNIIQCHKGELDSFLIEMMKNIPNSFSFRGCTFDNLSDAELMNKFGIPLLTSILSIISNNTVTTKLMQLISMGNALSVEILNQVNTSLSSLVKYSQYIIPINNLSEPVICIDQLDGNLIDNEYTIQTSLMIDNLLSIQKGSKCILFQIFQDKIVDITYYLCNETLIGTISTNDTYFSFILGKSIPFCKWFTIITTLSRNNDKLNILSYTKYDMPTSFIVPTSNFNASKLRVRIGFNENEDDISSQRSIGFPGFIRQVSMYSFVFPNDLIQSVLSSDYPPEMTDKNCVFSYPSSFIYETQPNCHYNQKITLVIKSFLDILVHTELFEFLPLFPHLDEMPSVFPQSLLSFIMTILSYSRELQKQFSYFPIISQLLLESNHKRLTYFLYLKFFSFIDQCSDRHIIIELLQHILLNCELWIHAEQSQLMRIVAHWGNSLYQACGSLITEAISFNSLIAFTRIYFWFKPIETDLIRGVELRSSSFDIELCRKHFDRLLLTIVHSTGYSNQYSISLISNSASCADSEQVIYYLSLLREICPKGQSEIIKHLFILFKAKKEEIFVETLKALYEISDDGSVLNNVYDLLTITNRLYFTEILFDKLLEIFPDYPLIYPLVIQSSLYLGQTAIQTAQKSINEMVPQSLYQLIIKNDFWMIYPLILAVNSIGDNSGIIQFLGDIINSTSMLESLNSVITAINYFKVTTLLPFEKVEEDILKYIRDLNTSSSIELKHQLFEVKASTLLFHYSYCSPALKQEFVKSPFYSKTNERSISKSTVISIKNDDLINIQAKPMHSDNILTSSQKIIKAKKLSTTQDLLDLFTNANVQIHQFYFGFHLNDEIQYQETLSEISKIVSYQKVDQLPNEKKEKLNVKSSTFYSLMTYLFAVQYKHSQNIYDSLHRFYLEAEPIVFARLEKFARNAHLYFNERKTETLDSLVQFGQSEIGVAFEAIDRNNEFIYNSMVYTKKTRLKLERRVGKAKKSNEKSLYYHQFRFCANFTQPKLNYYAKDDSFVYEDIQKRSHLSRKSFESNAQSIYQVSCRIIKINKSYPTHFCLTKDSIILNGLKIIDFVSISFILRKRIGQRETGVEFITFKGDDFLLDFSPLESQSIIKTILKSVKIPDSCIIQNQSLSKFYKSHLTEVTQNWKNHKITNFQYLMILNIFGGRSFRDVSNYPIFPLLLIPDNNESTFSIEDIGISLNSLKTDQLNVTQYLVHEEPFTSLQMNNEKVLGFNSYQQITTFLPPEFYYKPEIYLNLNNATILSKFDLPKWANNDPFEFIYILRKALESEKISRNLHLWIDNAFGLQSIQVNDQNNPKPLFTFQHPFRKDFRNFNHTILKSRKIESFEFSSTNSVNNILAASFILKSKTPKVICIMKNGKAKLYNLTITAIQDSSHNPELNDIFFISNLSKVKSKSLPFPITQNLQFCPMDFGLVVIAKGELYYITENLNVIQCNSPVYEMCNNIPLNYSFLNGDGNIISILNDDGNVYLSKTNSSSSSCCLSNSFFNSISLHSNPLLLSKSQQNNLTISSPSKLSKSIDLVKIGHLQCEKMKMSVMSLPFDILAVASIEGNVDLYSLYNATYCCSCNTENEIADFILITKGFGFIVIFTNANIFLFDINGFLIRKVQNSFRIRACDSFVDDNGFDFITVVREDGAIFVSEVFYLKFEDPIAYVKNPIVTIQYYNDIHSILVITKNHKLFSIPYCCITK